MANIETAKILGEGIYTKTETVKQINIDVGHVLPFASTVIPPGFIECNGVALSRTVYEDLYNVIGVLYGSGDGLTTFNLPDLRGEFIRGTDNGRGIDANRSIGSSQRGSQMHLDDGNNQCFTFFGNSGNSDAVGQNASDTWDNYDEKGTIYHAVGPHQEANNTYNDNPSYFRHTRPRNVSMMYCIKY